ncbi:MAG: diaminopimelate epimerase [Armatimonadetes bacterium]|nr:diaminopimelate epimerase [Armatimonadota bacterium]
MKGLPFLKMEAVGNSFVLVFEEDLPPGTDLSKLAIALCAHHTGVGSDGLLILGESHIADARMRMFNPDGTEDFCGNGLLLSSSLVLERIGRQSANIEAQGGAIVPVEMRGGLFVELGEPRFDAASVPFDAPVGELRDYPLAIDGHEVTIASMRAGSTHTIIRCDQLPEDELFFKLSPLIENHAIFPERTSVIWAQNLGENRLRIRIWERGAGETLGCGTGACAATVESIRRGESVSPVIVESKGGESTVEWRPGQKMRLSAAMSEVFQGVVESIALF